MSDKTSVITFSALGTKNRIFVDEGGKESALQKAVERITEIENRMSAFVPDSDLSLLRNRAGNGWQRVHFDTFHLIRKGLEFGALSGGAFDITVRPLVELWGINRKQDFVPDESEIEKALALVNYREVHMEPDLSSICLERSGQALDLGGIAKGYAADEVKRILLENRIRSALINLGGNVVAVGDRADGSPWRIGIQNPLAPTGEILGSLSVSDQTVVTSGCNERFFLRNGIRYHHLLDPRTGRPAQNSLLSVTVVSPSSLNADALTTALFILGQKSSEKLLKEVGAQAVFCTNDQKVTVTKGMKGNFQLFQS
jgi:FAD:protein FMN transferase